MGILNLRILLTAGHLWPKPNDPKEFLSLLGVSIAPYSMAHQQFSDSALIMEIGAFEVDSYREFGTERYEEFEKAVQECLKNFANWLNSVPVANVDTVQASGIRLGVNVELWMDDNQMDFNLPPSLSAELGRLNLPLYILSND